MNYILLNLGFPPTDNNLFANIPGKGRVKSERYRTWLRDAGNRYMAQKRFVKPVEGHFKAIVTLDARKRLTLAGAVRKQDCSNYGKAVLDALVEWGLIADDRYCDAVTLEWGRAPEGCRVEVYPVEAVSERAA